VRLVNEDGGLILQDEALDEMSQGREACRDQGCGGGGADGKLDTLKNGHLGGIRHAEMLDVGLEIVEQLYFGIDGS